MKAITLGKLLVYVGHNCPGGDREELKTMADWCAVIAPSEESAMSMIAAQLDLNCRERDDWKQRIEITQMKEIPISKWMGASNYPRYITQPQELRILGFREECEDVCDHCELASNGISLFYVCPHCRICKECGGCDCEDE